MRLCVLNLLLSMFMGLFYCCCRVVSEYIMWDHVTVTWQYMMSETSPLTESSSRLQTRKEKVACHGSFLTGSRNWCFWTPRRIVHQRLGSSVSGGERGEKEEEGKRWNTLQSTVGTRLHTDNAHTPSHPPTTHPHIHPLTMVLWLGLWGVPSYRHRHHSPGSSGHLRRTVRGVAGLEVQCDLPWVNQH